MGRLYNNQINTSGRLYQSQNLEPQKEGVLAKVGRFFKGRTEKVKEQYGLGQRLSKIEDGKVRLDENVARKQIGFTLGVSPMGLRDVSTVSKTVGILKESAQKQFTEALGPTKQRFKQQAEKVVPGLIKRRFGAFTRGGLHAKTGEQLTKAGEELERVIGEVPKNTRIGLNGVIRSLGKYKNSFTVVESGKRVVIDEIGYQNVQKLQNTLKQFGDDVSFGTLRKTRQIMDQIVTKGGKAFGRTLEEGGKIDATREAGNAIRKLIAQRFPNVAKVNAEYTFWKNVDEVLEETIKRTKPHGAPIGEQIAEVAGATGGLVSGGIGKAIGGALAFKWIRKILTSTGFRTLSAVAKDRIADLIAQGKFGAVMEIVRRTGITISNQSR